MVMGYISAQATEPFLRIYGHIGPRSEDLIGAEA